MAAAEHCVQINILQRALLWMLRPLLKLRYRKIAAALLPQLRPQDRILDVGCGSMAVGEAVSGRMDVSWVGIDVVDYHESGAEFHLYDGKTIPFDSGSFDVVLLSFVLHHCDDIPQVLRECRRVSSGKILIMEDLIDGSRESLLLTKIHDWIANGLLYTGIPLPYTFKTQREWETVFRSAGLETISVEAIQTHPLAFVVQKLFSIRKTRS